MSISLYKYSGGYEGDFYRTIADACQDCDECAKIAAGLKDYDEAIYTSGNNLVAARKQLIVTMKQRHGNGWTLEQLANALIGAGKSNILIILNDRFRDLRDRCDLEKTFLQPKRHTMSNISVCNWLVGDPNRLTTLLSLLQTSTDRIKFACAIGMNPALALAADANAVKKQFILWQHGSHTVDELIDIMVNKVDKLGSFTLAFPELVAQTKNPLETIAATSMPPLTTTPFFGARFSHDSRMEGGVQGNIGSAIDRARAKKEITIGDFFRQRVGNHANTVRQLVPEMDQSGFWEAILIKEGVTNIPGMGQKIAVWKKAWKGPNKESPTDRALDLLLQSQWANEGMREFALDLISNAPKETKIKAIMQNWIAEIDGIELQAVSESIESYQTEQTLNSFIMEFKLFKPSDVASIVESLKDAGIESIELLRDLTKDDLIELGVKTGHAIVLRKALDRPIQPPSPQEEAQIKKS